MSEINVERGREECSMKSVWKSPKASNVVHRHHGFQIIQRRLEQEFPHLAGTRAGRARAWFVFSRRSRRPDGYVGHFQTLREAREVIKENLA